MAGQSFLENMVRSIHVFGYDDASCFFIIFYNVWYNSPSPRFSYFPWIALDYFEEYFAVSWYVAFLNAFIYAFFMPYFIIPLSSRETHLELQEL